MQGEPELTEREKEVVRTMAARLEPLLRDVAKRQERLLLALEKLETELQVTAQKLDSILRLDGILREAGETDSEEASIILEIRRPARVPTSPTGQPSRPPTTTTT